MKADRPWNWLELEREDAATLWGVLEEFVDFLNSRYVERVELTIPACWAEHGALVEELTTLCWARFHAFETEIGTIGGAQFWHNYSLPMFLQRMPRWLGPDRLRKCQAGKHDSPEPEDGHGAADAALRRQRIIERDCAMRTDPSGPQVPR